MKTIPPETKDKVRVKATGTLPNGAPVIINSDGTVSSTIDNSETAIPKKGYIDQASPNSPAYIASVYDSYNDRVVFAWRDQNNSNYGTAIVGQIKGRTITWGTKTTFLTAQTEYIGMAFDTSQNKVLISFKHDGDGQKGYACVATVDPSNNSITFGTAVKFNDNGVTLYIKPVFDSNSNKTVIVYSDLGDSGHGWSVVATISGTSVSFGTAVEFVGIEVNELAVTFDSEHNKIALAYRKGSPTYYGAFKVGDVSGTSITWGLDTDILTANMQYHNITFDTTNNFVVGCFMDGGASNKGTLYVLEITDSFASNVTNVVNDSIVKTVYSTVTTQHNAVVYSPNSRTVAIMFYNANSGHSYILEGEIHSDKTADFFDNSGTALAGWTSIDYTSTYHQPIYSSSSKQVATFYVHAGFGGVGYMIKKFRRDAFGAAVQFESHAVQDVSAVYNAATKRVVVAYNDLGESKGYAVVGQVDGTTITFGTPVEYLATQPNQTSLVSLREEQGNGDCVVIVYANGSNVIHGMPAQINPANNSLTLGAANTLNSSVTSGGSKIGCCAYPPSGDAIIVSFDTNAGTAGGYAAVGVLNAAGNGITFGQNYIFNSGDSPEATMEYDPSNQIAAVFYRDDGNNNYGTSRTLAVSNTNQISYNSEVVFSSSNTTYRIDTTFDTTHNRFEVAFMNTGFNNGSGQIVYGFISGASLAFQSAATFQGAVGSYNPQPGNIRLSYNEEADLTAIIYNKDSQNKNICVLYKTDTGGSQFFYSVRRSLRSEASPIYNIVSTDQDIVYDANAKKTVVFFKDDSASNVGKAVVIDIGTANLTSENFIGMVSGGTVPTNGQAIVDIVGAVNEDQSGLTIGQQYYVQKDGTLSTTADTPSVLAGTALSATKLLVKK